MNAKTIKTIPLLLLMAVYICFLSSCTEEVKDFGFDGSISGMILDQSGNPVSGDASNSAMTVFLLGEEDRVPLEVRVIGDGSYTNTHLYPQSYSVWIEGPVDAPGQQTVDLTGSAVQHNITVTPFMAINEPSASISGGQVTVNYQITPGTGHAAADRVALVSTVAKVGVNTGNGPRWQTRTVSLDSNSGTASIALDTDLLDMSAERGGGKLHVRIAAKSDQSSNWNYSVPVELSAR